MSKLTDEQLTRISKFGICSDRCNHRECLAVRAARELRDLRTLIKGLLALPEPVWLSTQGRGHELWAALREAVES